MKSAENKPLFVTGKVLENRNINGDYFEIVIEAPDIARNARPGQFVMLSRWNINNLFLKRPFSFYQIDAEQGRFAILYKKIGKGTEILSQSKKADQVELIGSCGNGFSLPENVGKIALVARGIGVATLLPLAIEGKKKGLEIYSFLSAREKNLLLGPDKLGPLSSHIFYTTDDDWKGTDGKVTFFLEELLKNNRTDFEAVYVCGSKRLARHIRELQKEYHFAAYISLEERMGCGIGACKGCVINTIYGYQRVCKEGPVFPLEEVILNE
ncbi:MAG TPA: dihydroorotate dehydrogenase electron transfer subunit [Atribacterota bacterium]|nr:dihydroorotate dehydrogenase electron transfer subunit [Atribacterota bacterium]